MPETLSLPPGGGAGDVRRAGVLAGWPTGRAVGRRGLVPPEMVGGEHDDRPDTGELVCGEGGDAARESQHADDDERAQDPPHAVARRDVAAAAREVGRRRSTGPVPGYAGGPGGYAAAAGCALPNSDACAVSASGRSSSRIRSSGSSFCGPCTDAPIPGRLADSVVSASCPTCRTARSCCVAARPGWSSPVTPSWSPRPAPEPAEGEALLRTTYVGIDAAARTWLDDQPGYLPPVQLGEVIRAAGIGEVVAVALRRLRRRRRRHHADRLPGVRDRPRRRVQHAHPGRGSTSWRSCRCTGRLAPPPTSG